jgi:hypothetical protein
MSTIKGERKFMNFFVVLSVICCLTTSQAFASLKTSGSGSNRQIDTRDFPPEMKANYELLSAKCTRCHSLERLLVSYTTGVAPVSNQPFDLNHMRADIYKMLRRSNAQKNPTSKEESNSIFAVLKYMLDKSAN